jgi:hypothetical protein
VVDDYRPIRRSEQLAQANRSDRQIAFMEVRRTFLKYIVLDRRALWKPSAKLCDSFPLAHQFDFR